MKPLIILSILLIVFASACVQQTPITEITIPGHPVYTFSNDVRESLQVKADNSDGIRKLISSTRHLTVVFDGSDAKDNGSFGVVAFNIITKLQTYFVYEGQILAVDSYYYIGEQWFGTVNNTNTQVERPGLTDPVIWLKGPSTGANETSVLLDGNIIFVQGLTHKDLTLAGDRLTLIVLGIERV